MSKLVVVAEAPAAAAARVGRIRVVARPRRSRRSPLEGRTPRDDVAVKDRPHVVGMCGRVALCGATTDLARA